MPPLRGEPGLVTVYIQVGENRDDDWQAVVLRLPGRPTWHEAQRLVYSGRGREAIARALRFGSPPYVFGAENIAGPLDRFYPRIANMHWTRHPALHHVEPISG